MRCDPISDVGYVGIIVSGKGHPATRLQVVVIRLITLLLPRLPLAIESVEPFHTKQSEQKKVEKRWVTHR